jgi:hypothetical protein
VLVLLLQNQLTQYPYSIPPSFIYNLIIYN